MFFCSFRMNPERFDRLLELVQPRIEKQNTRFCEAISLKKDGILLSKLKTMKWAMNFHRRKQTFFIWVTELIAQRWKIRKNVLIWWEKSIANEKSLFSAKWEPSFTFYLELLTFNFCCQFKRNILNDKYLNYDLLLCYLWLILGTFSKGLLFCPVCLTWFFIVYVN